MSTGLRARPFRSHRTLRITARDRVSTLAALVLGLLAAYALLLFAWEPGLYRARNRTGAMGHAEQANRQQFG
jgi:hypothetical protein